MDEVSLISSNIYIYIYLSIFVLDPSMHNIIFFGNVDVIRTCDLYHAPLVQDKWVFQRRFGSIDALGINFWL